MWPLLFCLIVAATIIIVKGIVFEKSKTNIGAVSIRIMSMLKRKDITAAIQYCSDMKNPISNIIRRGLKKYKFGRKRVLEAIETGGKIEVNKLERGLTTLVSIAMTTPMLGLLGSIIGLISSFMKVQGLQSSANISHIAGAIWENLICSAFGLLIGIPSFAFYIFFVSFVKKNVFEMERVATDLIDVLDEPGKEIPVHAKSIEEDSEVLT